MRFCLALTMFLALGCGPNPKAPVTVMALLYNNANKLGPRETQLETVSNVVALKGSVVNLVGGASIVVDPNDPALLNAVSDQQLIDALYRSRGSEVHANLIDKSGVLWPADFHSWAMVTTYWNFEQAFLYFNQIYAGRETTGIVGADVLYWGAYKNLGERDPMLQDAVDNTFYFPALRAFVVAPFKELQMVPVSMNVGIVGHEFAHRVFTHRAFGDQASPIEETLTGAPLNIIRGLNEGLADFHGYGVTCVTKGGPGCLPKFIEASYGATLADARDFSVAGTRNCMTVELRTKLSLPRDSPSQYKLGTLFAAALYQASEPVGKRETMQRALIDAYDDELDRPPGLRQLFEANRIAASQNITLEAVSDVLINHVTDPELQRRVCTELVDRLNLDRSKLTKCPVTAGNGNTCPDLPPP